MIKNIYKKLNFYVLSSFIYTTETLQYKEKSQLNNNIHISQNNFKDLPNTNTVDVDSLLNCINEAKKDTEYNYFWELPNKEAAETFFAKKINMSEIFNKDTEYNYFWELPNKEAAHEFFAKKINIFEIFGQKINTQIDNLNLNINNNLFNLNTNDFYFYIFEFYFILILITLLIFGVFYTNKKNTINNLYYIINNALINLLYFFFIICFILIYNNYNDYYLIFTNYYISNNLIIYLKLFVIVFCFLFLSLLKQYIKNLNKYFDYEFIIIILFSIFSMLSLISSNDFLSLYLIVELQSLSFYVLVSLKQNSSLSTEAGLKYFILGSFSSGLLLFGISLIYGFSGLLNFEDIYFYVYALTYQTLNVDFFLIQNGFLLGLLFVLISFLFKLGVVPFHMWIPDVYEGAPTIITAFLSILPKIVILFVLLKLYLNIFYFYFYIWHYIFLYISIFSIILGAIGAIYQIKIKRLFTYSMINNSGFFLLGLSLGNIEGVQSTLLYILIYLFLMLGIFIVILSLKERNNNLIIKKISLLINLYNINPILALTFSLLLFSIAGIPPLIGFYGKFYLFLISLKNAMYFITFMFIIFSIVSIFYYIRLIKLIFFNKNKFWFFFDDINKNTAIILSLISIFNIIFFLNPNIVFEIVYNMSLLFYI